MMLKEKADAGVGHREDKLSSQGNHRLRHEWDQSSGEEQAANAN